jgi:hypothetical protein
MLRPRCSILCSRIVFSTFSRRMSFYTARVQILTPRSAPACLLPPNADIAMFAGRSPPNIKKVHYRRVQRGDALTLPHVLR